MGLRVVVALALLWSSGCLSAGYDGARNGHFNGYRFQNVAPTRTLDSAGLLRWLLTRDPGPWEDQAHRPPGPPPPERVEGDDLRVTWVGHSTVLVQTAGLNVLTDPVWSEEVGPVGLVRERRRPPGIRFEDLPPIDLVLVSHDHFDHLDPPTVSRLAREHRPRFVVGLGVGERLADLGIGNVVELDWWQSVDLGAGRRVHGVPAQHHSGRTLLDQDRTLWLGFVLETPGGDVYYAGDTGFGPHFLRIRERFGRPRLAILPIGVYRPREVFAAVHMSPKEAVQAHRILGAHTSIPVHFGTFALGDEGRDEPRRELKAALRPDEARSFPVLEHGLGVSIAQPYDSQAR